MLHCNKFVTFIWPCCIVTNVSDSSFVHRQEFIHCTLSNGICHTAFEQDQDGTAVPSWSCSKAVYRPVWHIPLLSVQSINSWWWTDKLSKTCRVSCQNKFVKLVHLVGFIIEKLMCLFIIFLWGKIILKWHGLYTTVFHAYETKLEYHVPSHW